eukprot:ANDGO_03689.mRNA.1 hypothetical protein
MPLDLGLWTEIQKLDADRKAERSRKRASMDEFAAEARSAQQNFVSRNLSFVSYITRLINPALDFDLLGLHGARRTETQVFDAAFSSSYCDSAPSGAPSDPFQDTNPDPIVQWIRFFRIWAIRFIIVLSMRILYRSIRRSLFAERRP